MRQKCITDIKLYFYLHQKKSWSSGFFVLWDSSVNLTLEVKYQY